MNKEADVLAIIKSALTDEEKAEKVIKLLKPINHYKLNDLLISCLDKFYKHVIESGDYKLDVRFIPFLTQAERLAMSKLRFHGLIAKVMNEKGKQINNMWLLTHLGAQFENNLVGVLERVDVWDNKIQHPAKNRVVFRRDFKVLQDWGPNYTREKYEPLIKQLLLIS